jgi:hypothetical protein
VGDGGTGELERKKKRKKKKGKNSFFLPFFARSSTVNPFGADLRVCSCVLCVRAFGGRVRGRRAGVGNGKKK